MATEPVDLRGLSPMKKVCVGGGKGMFSPQYLPSAPRSGDRGENFEVGAEHILDRSNAQYTNNFRGKELSRCDLLLPEVSFLLI